ncbi:MAG TPA: O-antigen ligase family protein [Longimicrobiales bacterium]|nr:O-antigen ligase family protein [Longimicrobiales bacterium]
MTARGALEQSRELALFAAATGATLVVGFATVRTPYLFAGAMLGLVLLAAVVVRPLMVIALLMLLGPVNLSFITGGLKGLFESMGGLDMSGIRLIGVSAGLGAMALVVPRMRAVLFGRWSICYVLFMLWGVLALARSPNVVDGLRLWLKIGYPLLIFVTVVALVERREQLDRLIDWALIGAAITIFVINPLHALAGGGGMHQSIGLARLGGLGIHENPLSFFLLVMFYISLTRLILRGQLRYLLLCAGASVWLVLTLTRITFLAAIVGLAGMALFGAVNLRNWRVLAAAAAAAAALAVPLAPLVLERSLGFVATPAELLDLARNPIVLYESINWQGRELAWPIIYAAFTGAPWAGLGLGSSILIMEEYFPATVGPLVHNEYLRLAVETGIIGVLLFASAIMVWFMVVVSAARRAGDSAREYALPAFAALLSWGIIAITDNAFDYYAPFTQFAALLAAACGAVLMMAQREQTS